MTDNLSVNVTADTTALRAQLAVAKAELASYSAAVKATAKDIVAAGSATAEQTAALEQNVSGQRKAQAAVAALTAQMGQGTAATKTAQAAVEGATGAIKNHGAQTEAMVLVHEAMQGRFKKMASSSMVLAQRIGDISLAIQGMIATMAIAGVSASHLYDWFQKLSAAKLTAEAGGLGSGMSNADLGAQVDKLTKIKDITPEIAGQAVHAFTQMRGITRPVMDELTSDVRALSLRMGIDVPSAARKIVEAWDLDVKAGADLLQQTRASARAVDDFTRAAQNDDAIKARTILLQELSRSAREVATQTRESRVSVEDQKRVAEALATPMPKGSASAAMARAPVRDTEAIAAAERLAVALKTVTDARRTGEAQPWSEQMKLELDKATLEVERKGHAQGRTWQQIHESMAQTTADFWQNQMTQTKEGTKNREFAERQLFSALATLEAVKIQTDNTASRQALETRLAQLSAEQAASRDNFATVLRLEDQKLALLKGAGEAYSVQYQDELRRREEMIRQHNAQISRLGLEHLAKMEEVDRQAFGEAKANLDAQVADHLITRQEEISQLLDYADQLYAVEHQALQDFIATQDLEVAERQKALDQMAQMEASHSRTQAALRAQMAQANRQDQQRVMSGYEQMFSGIEGAARSSVTGLIMGTMTWQQAEMRVATQVLDSFISLGASVAERWLATEIAKTFATQSGVAQRVAAEQAEGASGWGAVLSGIVAQWTAKETAQTAVTSAGVATRTAEQAAGEATGVATMKLAAVSQINANAGVAAAGAYAALAGIPIIGPALGAAASMEALAQVLSYNALVAFDVGTNYVPQDMPAMVHKGEMIIPAYDAERIRSGGGGGGAQHFHFSPTVTHSGGSVGASLDQQVRDSFAYFRAISRNGALTLPGRRI